MSALTDIRPERWNHVLASQRINLWCIFIAASVGLILAVIPHVHSFWLTGSFEYLADTDDVLYATIARRVVAGSWTVADHAAPTALFAPSTYAWLQFAPVGWLTGALGLSPPGFLLLWRIIGGAALGISLFLLIRDALGRQWQGRSRLLLALSLALLCLADPGFWRGVPLLNVPSVLSILDHGVYLRSNPGEYSQYRVLSPLTGLPLVFLLLWRILPDKGRDVQSAIIAGIILGLLINLYFFFWTFAVVLLAAIGGWHLLRWLGSSDREVRSRCWSETKFCALVLMIGMAIGAPQLFVTLKTAEVPTANEALERTPRGIKLAADNPVRWQYAFNKPLVVSVAIGIVAASLLGVPALWTLVAACAVATALQASAAVTGIEFENYKWGHVANTTGYLVLCLVAANIAGRSRWLQFPFANGIAVTSLVLVTLAAVFIWRESLGTRESGSLMALNEEMRPLRSALQALDPASRIIGPEELVVAGIYARAGVLYGNHSFQSLISDEELIERYSLSRWAMGLSEAEALSGYPVGLPRDGRVLGEYRARWNSASVEAQVQKSFQSFGQVDLDLYRVSALLLQAGKEPPARSGQWRKLGQTQQWVLWGR